MKRFQKHIFIMISSIILLSSCCIFKKGAWNPLPSCKNIENAESNTHKKESDKTQEIDNIEFQGKRN